MKKMLAVICTVFLILNVSGISLAEETITQNSQVNSTDITVGYNAGVTYTVTIPASVAFSDSEKRVQRALQVDDVVLNEGGTLNVNLASLNGFKMMCGTGYIDYSLLINANEVPKEDNTTILTVSSGEKTGWVLLDFVTDLKKDNALYAGNYTDVLTFTVSVN